MSNHDTTTNPKPQHGAHSHKQAGKRGLLISFIIFMAWVVGIGLLLSFLACTHVSSKPIATNTDNGYYKDLLKKHASGKSNRYSLAFFVPVIGVDSQSLSVPTDTALPAQLSAARGQTTILIANHLLADYDGLTLQNKIAERRICRAVACVTESKTRHPIRLSYSVALTQKTTQGGHYHA